MASTEEIQYMQEHIEDTRVPGIIISSIVCGIATCLCVGLRFLARWMNRAGFGQDDYCLLAGLVLYLAFIITFSSNTKYGLGRHVILVNNPRMLTILIISSSNIYVVGMMFIKFSILLLYRRIFPHKTFHKYLLATGLIILSWAVATFFLDIFTCTPVAYQWDKTIKGTCINYGTVTFAVGITNVVVDFILLGLPLPILWGLQMSGRKKFLLFLLLGAGSSACIVSIVRLTYAKETLSTFDETWDSVNAGILSGVEMSTAIIACCFATYRPLIERLFFRNAQSSKGRSFEHSEGSRRRGWGKVSVTRDIDIELETRRDQSQSADMYVDTAPLKEPMSNVAPSMPSGEESAVPSEHWYGSPSHSWRADITTRDHQRTQRP